MRDLILNQHQNVVYNNNTVVLNNFGQESIDHLMKRFMYYSVNQGHGLIQAIRDIHFDPKHPENHNLTIKNKRERIAEVRENGKWISKSYDEIAEDLITNISMKVDRFNTTNLDILRTLCDDIDRLQYWWNNVGTSDFNEKEYDNIVKRIFETIIECRPNISIEK